MTKVILIAALLSATFAPPAQRNDNWPTVQVCHITLRIPTNLKRNGREGIDSCIAEFEKRDLLLSIDYGWYGGAAKKSDVTVDFKEQPFSIGGKTGTLATYIDDSLYARKHPERKYVAHLHVVVHQGPSDSPMKTSLMITIRGRTAKQLEIGSRILATIRFD